jgi:hypothetical protein
MKIRPSKKHKAGDKGKDEDNNNDDKEAIEKVNI